MMSLGTMCCGDRFCANRKVGLGVAGGFRNAVHMVAVVAGYKKAFVGTGQAISLHLCTNGLRKYPSYLVRAGTKYFFSDERHPDYSRYTNRGLV